MTEYSIEKTFEGILNTAATHAHVYLNGTDEIEAVHQIRVGMRKLKTISWLLTELLPEVDTTPVAQWVNHWMSLLADVRDKDIAIELLDDVNEELIDQLVEERDAAREVLHEALSASFEGESFILPSQVKEALDACDAQMGSDWSSKASKHFKRMIKAYRRNSNKLDIYNGKALHQYRVEGKRIKNTIDILGGINIIPRKRVRKDVSELLRVLGGYNDKRTIKKLLASETTQVRNDPKVKDYLFELEKKMAADLRAVPGLIGEMQANIRRAIRKAAAKKRP